VGDDEVVLQHEDMQATALKRDEGSGAAFPRQGITRRILSMIPRKFER